MNIIIDRTQRLCLKGRNRCYTLGGMLSTTTILKEGTYWTCNGEESWY